MLDRVENGDATANSGLLLRTRIDYGLPIISRRTILNLFFHGEEVGHTVTDSDTKPRLPHYIFELIKALR